MPKFVGREPELELLNSIQSKAKSSLVVIRGRRRIGKSTLIKEFAKNYNFLSFEGLAPTPQTTANMQRATFVRQLSAQTSIPEIVADDWSKLLQLLWLQCQNSKVVILFDEISWMGSKDPEFLSKIKMAWDNYFVQHKNLMFILCGSASSWIEKNILSSTGFVGRISHVLTLEELPFIAARKFWPNKIAGFEIFKVLSIIGGVPKYLEEINPKLPAEENIKNLCFTPGGFLMEEFERIFNDLFLSNSEIYRKIVVALVEGSKTFSEISQAIDFPASGRLKQYLTELELSGFVSCDYMWSLSTTKESKTQYYRLKDNYLRFYLKYISPNLNKIKRNAYAFKNLSSLPNWEGILGLQFENLVLSNRLLIQKKLKINLDDIIYDNPYFQRKTRLKAGCQIDYMIQTKFNTLYICEIKFSRNKIGMEVTLELESKIKALKVPKHFSFRPVLIHVGGVSEDLEDSGYFAEIIDFSEILE